MKIINNLTLDEFEKVITKLFLNYRFVKDEVALIANSSTILKKKWRLKWIPLPIYVKELVFVEDHVEAKRGPITIKFWDGDYVFLNCSGDKVGVIYRDSSNTQSTTLIDGPFTFIIRGKRGKDNY